MPNLPYPYLDQAEFPSVPAALVVALQTNLDALEQRLQTTEANSARFQVGGANHGNWLAGNITIPITLPEAWANEHIAFIAIPTANTSRFDLTCRGCAVTGLGTGEVYFSLGSQQNIDISWISVGR